MDTQADSQLTSSILSTLGGEMSYIFVFEKT